MYTVLFALLAFIVILPLVLGMEAVRNLLVRLKMSHVLSKIPKGMDIIWLYLMTPLAIISLVFGILAGGTAGHFRTSHGVSKSLAPMTHCKTLPRTNHRASDPRPLDNRSHPRRLRRTLLR